MPLRSFVKETYGLVKSMYRLDLLEGPLFDQMNCADPKGGMRRILTCTWKRMYHEFYETDHVF